MKEQVDPKGLDKTISMLENDDDRGLTSQISEDPSLLEWRDWTGEGLLHVAARYSAEKCVNILLEKGMSLAELSSIGDTVTDSSIDSKQPMEFSLKLAEMEEREAGRDAGKNARRVLLALSRKNVDLAMGLVSAFDVDIWASVEMDEGQSLRVQAKKGAIPIMEAARRNQWGFVRDARGENPNGTSGALLLKKSMGDLRTFKESKDRLIREGMDVTAVLSNLSSKNSVSDSVAFTEFGKIPETGAPRFASREAAMMALADSESLESLLNLIPDIGASREFWGDDLKGAYLLQKMSEASQWPIWVARTGVPKGFSESDGRISKTDFESAALSKAKTFFKNMCSPCSSIKEAQKLCMKAHLKSSLIFKKETGAEDDFINNRFGSFLNLLDSESLAASMTESWSVLHKPRTEKEVELPGDYREIALSLDLSSVWTCSGGRSSEERDKVVLDDLNVFQSSLKDICSFPPGLGFLSLSTGLRKPTYETVLGFLNAKVPDIGLLDSPSNCLGKKRIYQHEFGHFVDFMISANPEWGLSHLVDDMKKACAVGPRDASETSAWRKERQVRGLFGDELEAFSKTAVLEAKMILAGEKSMIWNSSTTALVNVLKLRKERREAIASNPNLTVFGMDARLADRLTSKRQKYWSKGTEMMARAFEDEESGGIPNRPPESEKNKLHDLRDGILNALAEIHEKRKRGLGGA